MGSLLWVTAAAVAAAPVHQKATVLHRASGQPARRLGRNAELSLLADGLNLTLSLEADFNAFHRSYKELVVHRDGTTTTTRAGARGCHYKGAVTDARTGEGGRATAFTCGGAPEAVVRLDGGRVLELAWRHGAHAVFDPSEGTPRTCGVDPRRHAPHRRGANAVRHRRLRGHDHDAAHHAHADHEDHDHDHDHEDHGREHDEHAHGTDGHGDTHHAHDAHEHEEHTHHEDHAHEDHNHDLFRRGLGANECAAGPTKYVGVVVFNDAARYAKRGVDVEAHTAALFDVVHDIYTEAAPYGLYDGDRLNCRVVPVLLGQVTWRDGNPDCESCVYEDDVDGGSYTRNDGNAGVFYARGTSGCAACGDACTSNEVSANCLLDSLGLYVDAQRSDLESALGVSIDTAVILSGEDFSATTVGLAWMNGLCVDTWSAAIVEDLGSVAITAAVFAHELGHLLGMGHDSAAPNIMEATSSGLEWGTALQFRDPARDDANAYFTDTYGVKAWTPECLNDNVETSWDAPVCGDGIVDRGETCDPGIFIDDACCSSECQLEEGCLCANADACCTDGAFTAAGVECRAAQHAECDFAEACTGLRGDCPTDLYKSPGSGCTETIFEDDDARDDADGKCYKGACVSQAGNCIDPNTGGVMTDGSSPLTEYCDSSGFSDCSATWCSDGGFTSDCWTYNQPARDGTKCASGKQCFTSSIDGAVDISIEPASSSSACVDSDNLKTYHWFLGDDGCREAQCVDEEGSAVAFTYCEDAAPDLPSTCSVAPTVSPAPSVSPVPTAMPTTAAPSVTFAPTDGDDDDDDVASKLLGQALLIALIVLVGFVVVIGGLICVCACFAKAICGPKHSPPRAQGFELPLPPNWSRQVDQMSGRAYYMDHATGATSWVRPG